MYLCVGVCCVCVCCVGVWVSEWVGWWVYLCVGVGGCGCG